MAPATLPPIPLSSLPVPGSPSPGLLPLFAGGETQGGWEANFSADSSAGALIQNGIGSQRLELLLLFHFLDPPYHPTPRITNCP